MRRKTTILITAMLASSSVAAQLNVATSVASTTDLGAVKADQNPASWGYCEVALGEGADGRKEIIHSEVFPTQHKGDWGRDSVISVAFDIVQHTTACRAFVEQVLKSNPGRRDFSSPRYLRIYQSQADVERAQAELKNLNPQQWHYISKRRPESESTLASSRMTETVAFRDPNTSLGQNGYAGTTFDVEYQFLACMGELHIAYSLVEDSVGIGRLAGGGDRVLRNGGRGRANYWLDGKVYKVDSLPEKIVNLPLKGSVWAGHQDQPLGRFADDHAGKALGFGCFSGQTKKIANLDELKNDAGKVPTKDELPKIFEKLRVNFATNEILTSAAAEESIRSGLASKGDSSAPKQANADRDVGPSDAELRAQQRAAREAEFQAKMKAYEEELAANKAAVEKYNADLQAVEAQKVANAERAKAIQEEHARRQTEHAAEVERIRQLNEANQAGASSSAE